MKKITTTLILAIAALPATALTIPSTVYNPVPSGQYRTLKANTIKINPAVKNIQLGNVTAQGSLSIKSAEGGAGTVIFDNLTLYSSASTVKNVKNAEIQSLKSAGTASNTPAANPTLSGEIRATKIIKNPSAFGTDSKKLKILKEGSGSEYIEFPTKISTIKKYGTKTDPLALRWVDVEGVFEGEDMSAARKIKILAVDYRDTGVACPNSNDPNQDACCIQDSYRCKQVMADQIKWESEILGLTK